VVKAAIAETSSGKTRGCSFEPIDDELMISPLNVFFHKLFDI